MQNSKTKLQIISVTMLIAVAMSSCNNKPPKIEETQKFNVKKAHYHAISQSLRTTKSLIKSNVFAYNFNHSLRKKCVAIAYVGSYVNKQLHDNVKKLIRETN